MLFNRFVFVVSRIDSNCRNRLNDDYTRMIKTEDNDHVLKDRLDMFMKVYEFYLAINQCNKILLNLVMCWKIVYSMVKTSMQLKKMDILKF